MDTEYAEKIKREADPKLEQYAEEFRNTVSKPTLQLLRDSGLITEESFDELSNHYQYYTPAKGKVGMTGYRKTGNGFSVSGRDIIRAKGRKSLPDNPVIRGIMDMESAIIRDENNQVVGALKQLVVENPNKLWHVEKVQYIPSYDKDGEIVFYNQKQKEADDVVVYHNKGKIEHIVINDTGMVDGIKKIGMGKSVKVLRAINTYIKTVNLMLNPDWFVNNFTSDIQQAVTNIGGEKSKTIAFKIIKDVGPAVKGIYEAKIDKGKNDKWVKLFSEFEQYGGPASWNETDTAEQRTIKLEKQLRAYVKHNKLSSFMRKFPEYITDVSYSIENGVRLSTYHRLVESGVSKEKAAQYAKNVTLNFEKHGSWGPLINSIWLFSNAGIQQTARMAGAIKNRRMQEIVAGMIIGSAALSFMMRAKDEDDWEQTDTYIKD
jgi:hypothetical protein